MSYIAKMTAPPGGRLGRRSFHKALARARLRQGFLPWWSPNRELVWARVSGRGDRIETDEISPDELDVLDEVLREKR